MAVAVTNGEKRYMRSLIWPVIIAKVARWQWQQYRSCSNCLSVVDSSFFISHCHCTCCIHTRKSVSVCVSCLFPNVNAVMNLRLIRGVPMLPLVCMYFGPSVQGFGILQWLVCCSNTLTMHRWWVYLVAHTRWRSSTRQNQRETT